MTEEREILAPVKIKQLGWPDYWSAKALEEQNAQIGPRAFERGFRQKAQADSDLIFPYFTEHDIYEFGVNWRNISDPDLAHKDYDETGKHPFYVSPDWPRYIGCDLSGKARRGTVIFTLAVSPRGIRHILDIKMGAWGAGPEFVRHLLHVFNTSILRPRKIFVENNAMQQTTIDNIKEMGGEFASKVQAFRTGSNKMDKQIGLPGINIQYLERKWKIAIPHQKNSPSEPDKKNPTLCLCGRCMFVRDTLLFTLDDLDETPDTIAAQFIAKEASRQGGSYTDTSAQVVKVSREDVQKRIALPGEQLRIPVNVSASGKRQGGDFGRGLSSRMPHPDGTVHEKGTCATCDSF